MRNKIFLTLILVLSGSLVFSLNGQLNVKKFGAKGNGTTLESRFIQKAIDKAFENGGGVVNVPPGTYLIGTLILKDNVELHLEPGAMLLGSPNFRDYAEIIHKLDSRTNGLYAKHFMIFAEGAKNISITGTGIIHGNGLKNFQESDPQNERPFMVRLVNCENVTIRDVKLLESANWTLHLLGCRDVNIDGIVIENHVDSNRDGIDIDACNRVTISDSRLLTGDDAIVIKATNDTLCQNIAITNCIIRTDASAIKTGTESNGGFKNITVSNCVIKDLPRHAGIELMTVDGGIMQNIVLENITMENVATPFFIRLGNRARPFKPGQYVNHQDDVSDIYLNNIIVLNSTLPSSIIGLNSKKIRNIVISNYSLRSTVAQKPVAYNEVPFEEFEYPAASYFKNLPAFGIYCRNIDGLQLDNITMYAAENETRPALVFDRVNDLQLISVRGQMKNSIAPLAHFRSLESGAAAFCRLTGSAGPLFETEGSVALKLTGNILLSGQEEIATVTGLKDDSFFEDFQTDLKYIVDKGEILNGMTAASLRNGPVNFSINMTKRGSIQMCLLVLNRSEKPEKVLVKFEGLTQEFTVNWNDWGWAPITLLKEYPADQKVDFEVVTDNKSADLLISRVYLRYQDVRKTD
jgi:hypothetical protein